MNTLYHYCSAEAFYAMISGRAIWLSSLSQSNDFLEGRLVSASVARLAAKDQMDVQSTKSIENAISSVEDTTDALGFCLSEDGDLLSQWRGYAANAAGFAIGFSRHYLERLCSSDHPTSTTAVTLGKVAYALVDQDELIQPIYSNFRSLVSAGMLRRNHWQAAVESRSLTQLKNEAMATSMLDNELLIAQLSLVPKLYLLKSFAFSEEKEWRILAPYLKMLPEMLQYRHSNGRIIPHRTYALPTVVPDSIVRVVQGPRNPTPINVTQDFLRSCGYEQAQVEMSMATYRG